MPRTSLRPTTQWLADQRARVAYTYEQASDISQYLDGVACKYETKAERYRRRADFYNCRVLTTREHLSEIDKQLIKFDSRIVPEFIAPVNGWQGKYGPRGTIKKCVVEYLRAHSPNWIPTSVITEYMHTVLKIKLETPNERRKWRHSFGCTLWKLLQTGVVERQPPPKPSEAASWRFHVETPVTLAELRQKYS